MSSPVTPAVDIEQQKRFRNRCYILQLFVRTVTQFLAPMFRDRWATYVQRKHPYTVDLEWKCDKACGEMLINLCDEVPSRIKKILIQGQLDQWNVPSMASAIRAVSLAVGNDYIWQQQNDAMRRADQLFGKVVKLTELSDNQYENYWNRLKAALIDLGDTDADIEEYKNAMTNFPSIGVRQLRGEAATIQAEAKKCFEENNFARAADLYSELLKKCSGLSFEDKLMVYNSRSEAYFLVGTENSLAKSLFDAKLCAQLRPVWWSGYYRMGLVYCETHVWDRADYNLGIAQALFPVSQIVQQKIYETKDKAKTMKFEGLAVSSYRLGKHIAAGVHGFVFNVTNMVRGKQAVMKMVKNVPSEAKLLGNERSTLIQISNLNGFDFVPKGFDAGNFNGHLWLVMEKGGPTLNSVMEQYGDDGLSSIAISIIAIELFEKLRVFHNYFSHGDLHVGNLLLDIQMQNLLLIDFGLTKKLEGMSQKDSRDSILMDFYDVLVILDTLENGFTTARDTEDYSYCLLGFARYLKNIGPHMPPNHKQVQELFLEFASRQSNLNLGARESQVPFLKNYPLHSYVLNYRRANPGLVARLERMPGFDWQ